MLFGVGRRNVSLIFRASILMTERQIIAKTRSAFEP